jgi:hypothetical protein
MIRGAGQQYSLVTDDHARSQEAGPFVLRRAQPVTIVALSSHFREVEPTHIFRRSLSEGKDQPQARFGLTALYE